MPSEVNLITGEFVRTIDDRYRLTLPPELATAIGAEEEASCVLGKERYGALSLWNQAMWRERIATGIDLVKQKIQAGRLSNRVAEVQQFARLLSTRFSDVNLRGRGRLVVPEGFREFLGVKPGGDCIVVGAGMCVEIWHPDVWRDYLKQELAAFGPLFEQLSN